ncbi:MAG: uracil-DNA glycosylase, partial [Myxococcota bacterium]|nr:uracil-DNA glycosylase [Myxococcota bacterium]
FGGVTVEAIPLPHPSGASTWHRTEPGKTLLLRALARIGQHEAWQELLAARARTSASSPPQHASP